MRSLGEGFRPGAFDAGLRRLTPAPPVEEPRENEMLAELLLQAVDRLAAAAERLQPMAPPAPDFPVDQVVQAVVDLGGTRHTPTAEEIADAIARRLHIPEPPAPVDVAPFLEKVAKGLETLEHRMRGIAGSNLGGGGLSDIRDRKDRKLGVLYGPDGQAVSFATEETLAAISGKLPDLTGTYGLHAGVSGLADVEPDQRIVAVYCIAGPVDATVTIGTLDPITVPATRPFHLEPRGNVVGVDVTFANTVSYVVEVLS